MRHYTQLTKVQRYQIFALKKEGLSQQAIAFNIGVHRSTICREDIDKALESGMDDWLTKPIEVEKLYAILLKYLRPAKDA